MEKYQSGKINEQWYDGSFTEINARNLATELCSDLDYNRLIDRFDQGLTPVVYDVGGMFTAQRERIIDAYMGEKVLEGVYKSPKTFSSPVRRLHNRIEKSIQKRPVGNIFFSEMVDFLDKEIVWAKELDDLLFSMTGWRAHDIINSSDSIFQGDLLLHLTEDLDEDLIGRLAVYLAGRSLYGENGLEEQYGNVLRFARKGVSRTICDIARHTGLSEDMTLRALEQIERAGFGSLDRIENDTLENVVAGGCYLSGTLRMVVKIDNLLKSYKNLPYKIVSHELHHVASAQTDKEKIRCGLRVVDQGIGIDEGMTEFLTQLSIGSPNIERLVNGNLRLRKESDYQPVVFGMLALYKQFEVGRNEYFATLFNAYHGDVKDQGALEEAIDMFYRTSMREPEGCVFLK